MDKPNMLTNYESEYSLEIKNVKISLEELRELGLSEQDLKAEAYLRTIYGDAVLNKKEETAADVITGQKTVEKINEKDISLNRSLSNEHEKIERDDFNFMLEGVLAKVKKV